MKTPPTEDLRQSTEYADYMRRRGWEVGKLKASSEKGKVNYFVKKLPLIGSVVKIQHPQAVPLKNELDTLAKRHRALFVKIEPAISHPPLAGSYLQADTWPLLPSKTLHLDLAQPEELLWEKLDPDARYSIRKAVKTLAITTYQLSAPSNKARAALQQLAELLKGTGRNKGFTAPKWKELQAKAECFGEKAWLIMASGQEKSSHYPIEGNTNNPDSNNSTADSVECGQPYAGCLLLAHDGVAYYHHAASSPEGRKLLSGYPVLWEAIKLAQGLGCHTFDFEGVYDHRFPKATRNWEGFTYFKKKFGGKEIEFPAPLVKYYSPLMRLLFTLFS